MAQLKMGGFAARWLCLFGALTLAGCMGSSGGKADRTPQDIVDNIPDNIIPIVIENEDEIREIIDTELDADLREEAGEIIDLIVAVTATTVSSTSVSASSFTD